jgi:hypothetical protein
MRNGVMEDVHFHTASVSVPKKPDQFGAMRPILKTEKLRLIFKSNIHHAQKKLHVG